MESNCSLDLWAEPMDVFNFSNTSFLDLDELDSTFTWKEYLKMSVYLVTIVAALVGNFAVIVTVVTNRVMRTTINYYLLNLAVADTLICIFCMWVHFVNSLSTFYVLGSFMCRFEGFAKMTCLTCSVLTLSAISCDRFIAIMFPLQAHVRVTKQRTSAVIGVIWITSAAISVPLIVFSRLYTVSWTPLESVTYCGWTWPTEASWDAEREECVFASSGRKLYYLLVTVALFFLPVAIMLTAYSLIVWRLWITQMPGERSAANINAQCRAKKKVITMVCTVLIAFVICWMPLQVIVLYSQFGDSKLRDKEMPDWFNEASSVATYIAYSNSLLNPIIYGGFNNNFRQGLCTVLHCYMRRKPSQLPRGWSQRSRMTVSTGTVPTRDSCRGASYAPDKHVAHMELVPVDKVAPPPRAQPMLPGSQRHHVRPKMEQHCWHPVYD
ncbi:QRFP-like peptide receptor isoform X3 [Dermacentor albipictus]|uniref:QRFP-like peptide receptor isoform X3 n=1 Tax=Dermacentor albipictus TaxID=60249 RepID=UPI0038FC7362